LPRGGPVVPIPVLDWNLGSHHTMLAEFPT
jgi:hypothetical protein